MRRLKAVFTILASCVFTTLSIAAPVPQLLVENLVAPIDVVTIPDDTGRRFFVTYTAPLSADAPDNWSHTRIVSEFTVDSDNPDQLNAQSERVLLEQPWPSRKHNGGALAFGPDNYLYIGFGDGGGIHGIGPETINDAYSVPADRLWWDSTAQDVQSLYGKILRIDVNHGYPGYAIPANNPFVGKPGRDEIYAWGFRNPYRLSFDADGSSRFYITAVAETLWEAIYRVDQPGNYGWPLKEGTHCFDRTRTLNPPSECEPAVDPVSGDSIFDPVVEYPNMSVHREGLSSCLLIWQRSIATMEIATSIDLPRIFLSLFTQQP